MATTLCSLHILGAKPADISPLLKGGDVIRTLNAPWLSVLPGQGEDDAGYTRMKKLAKRSGGKALVFFCFDDDEYELTIYEGGKRTGGFNSRTEMFAAKAKKVSLALRGDLSLEKSLLLLRKCGGLEEQIELLEELLGVALYDIPEVDERRVEQGDEVRGRILAREKALRNRPNQYALTPLPQEEWPPVFARSLRLAKEMCAMAAPFQASSLVTDLFYGYRWLPPGRGAAAEVFEQFRPERAQAVVIIDEKKGVRRRFISKGDALVHVYWLTEESLPVCSVRSGLYIGQLICLDHDGGIRWRFAPKLTEHEGLTIWHTSDDGVITVHASMGTRPIESRIWRIDGETGRVLHECAISAEHILIHLVWVEAINAFAGYAIGTNELIVLDSALNETRAVSLGPDSVRLDLGTYDGPYIMLTDFRNSSPLSDALIQYDLRDDSMTAISLEMSNLSFETLLQDNDICTVRITNGLPLCIFNAQGRLISRNSVKGGTNGVFQEGDACYVISSDSTSTLDTEIRLWRLDKKA